MLLINMFFGETRNTKHERLAADLLDAVGVVPEERGWAVGRVRGDGGGELDCTRSQRACGCCQGSGRCCEPALDVAAIPT